MAKNNKNTQYSEYVSNELSSVIKAMLSCDISELSVREVTPELFMVYTLGNPDTMLYKAMNGFLNSFAIGLLYNKFFKTVQDRQDIIPAGIEKRKVVLSAEFGEIMEAANKERTKMGSSLINTDHVLLAILSNDSDACAILKAAGVSYKAISDVSAKLHDITDKLSKEARQKEERAKDDVVDFSKIGALLFGAKKKNVGVQYCKNLNGIASLDKIDPLIGRDKELTEIESALSRRKCHNAILVGKSGCGKTAIVEGLARRINEGTAPMFFLDKTIFQLKVSDVIAGTGVRGQFEERMGKVISDIKTFKNSILFIDDIQNFTGSNKKDEADITSFFTNHADDSDIHFILSTDEKGYNAFIGSVQGAERRFRKVVVDPLNEEEALKVLSSISKEYGSFHGVRYSNDILKSCIKLSDRYISDMTLPSSAIDVMDEAGAYRKMNGKRNKEIVDMVKRFNQLKELEALLISQDMGGSDEMAELKENIAMMKVEITDLSKNRKEEDFEDVTIDDIVKVISSKTGVEISRINKSEKEILSGMEGKLKDTVIGQDEAIRNICNAIKRNKMGFYKKNRPIYSAFFVGLPGRGKTLTAKALAKEVFGDEKYLVRFDMSEYSDKTSVSKLIGTGAGYIGYDDGGLLTEAVKNRKYAVVLFDEIEKADMEVYNILLQVLDEATLTDNKGVKVDFRNTIIIMTSNVGTKRAKAEKPIGFSANKAKSERDIILAAIKDEFPPEFINRLDDIVFFNDLTDDDMMSIVKMEVGKMLDRSKNGGYNVEVTDNVYDYVLNESIKDENSGAREINRVIQREIEDKLIDFILGHDTDKKTIEVDAEEQQVMVSVKKKSGRN